jgi:hypothetical protein
MLLTILAAAAAISGAPASQPGAASANAVLIDCLVSGESLTDCRLVDAELGSSKGEAALKLAAQVQVPEAMALANPGRIRIRLNVNP